MQTSSPAGWLRFACALLALLGCLGCRSASPADAPALRVASDLDNRPFAYVDADGAPAGRDVEMMVELARRLGRELEWVRMPFDELLPAVERGEVDVVCATIGITPERAERVAFTRPYFHTAIVLLQRNDATLDQAIAPGARLYGGVGTTAERAIRLHAPQAELVSAGKGDRTSIERLEVGELFAIAMDEPAARARAQSSGGSLALRDRPLCGESYALVLQQQRDALRASLDRSLARMEAEGGLQKLDAAHGLWSSGVGGER
jgi:ABC-type amino acid transport substrate-binding protein